jgi:hypothetical protein
MEIARRLYLYIISAITLGMLITALFTLVNIALETILGSSTRDYFGTNPIVARREQLALVLATIGVSFPVWGLHWILAQRAAQAPAPRGDVERRSGVRALYLAGVMFVLLVVLMVSATGLVRYLLSLVLGAQSGDRLGPAQAVGSILIAGGFWAYHALVAARDARVPTSEAAAWLPRLYRYLAAFIGLMLLLYGIVGLVDLAGQVLRQAGGGVIGSGSRSSALAAALTNVIVGLAVWAGHWLWSNRIARALDVRGERERTARNRSAYLVLVIFVAASVALIEFAIATTQAIKLVTGTPDVSGGSILDVVGAVVLGLVFGAVWWAHRRFMITEAGHLSEGHSMGARRVDAYIVALLGLSIGGTGLAWLIGKAITVVFPGPALTASGGGGNSELAAFLGYTLVGSLAWLAEISIIARWRDRLSLSEASSTARRAYLLLAIAGALLGGISALVLLLNRVFGSILGVTGPRNLAAELATPTGVLIMAVLIAGLQFRWLRRDQAEIVIERTRAQQEQMVAEPAPPAAEAEQAAVAPATAPEATPAERWLVLTVPPGADPAAALEELRRALPEGYVLEEAD